jgi:hypothetical protein
MPSRSPDVIDRVPSLVGVEVVEVDDRAARLVLRRCFADRAGLGDEGVLRLVGRLGVLLGGHDVVDGAAGQLHGRSPSGEW